MITDGGVGDLILFSYFVGNGEDGLHLAWSEDGLHFVPLNGGRSVLSPDPAVSQLMRDPFILPGPDGDFHLVWTGDWSGQTIGYARSEDLIHWSAKALPVMAHEPTAHNCWAPEIAWDARRRRYLVFWSTTIPGRFPETDLTGDDGYNHRIYATTTTDFMEFAPTRLFFDPGYNVIDAMILAGEDRFHLIFKDETRHPVRKHLRVASANDIEGPYGDISEPFTESWTEGPSALRFGDAYRVFFDCYSAGKYGAVESRDLRDWVDISDRVSFPEGARHGAAFRVSPEVLGRLRSCFGWAGAD